MNLKIKKLHPQAMVPAYASAGAACFDLHAVVTDDCPIAECGGFIATYRTGLSFEIPQGQVMLVFSRSGHGFKDNIRLANCVGVIDSDYRGEVMVKMTGDGSKMPHFAHGDRIAQAMLVPVEQVLFEVVDELSSTERGNGGFGSTGR